MPYPKRLKTCAWCGVEWLASRPTVRTCSKSCSAFLRELEHPREPLTACARGHEFTPENTTLATDGSRQCRKCHARRENERRTRNRSLGIPPSRGLWSTALARFEAKVHQTENCWLWTGYLNQDGYGQLDVEGVQGAHRIAHELFIGPIPEGYEVDHLCRVRHCVNPAHLEAVTPLENKRRATGYRRRDALGRFRERLA